MENEKTKKLLSQFKEFEKRFKIMLEDVIKTLGEDYESYVSRLDFEFYYNNREKYFKYLKSLKKKLEKGKRRNRGARGNIPASESEFGEG